MKRLNSSIIGVLLVAILATVSVPAFAEGNDVQQPIEVNALTPAVRAGDGFTFSRPNDIGHMGVSASLIANYGYLPLSVRKTSDESVHLIEHQILGNVGVSFGLFSRVSFDALIPFGAMFGGKTEDGKDFSAKDRQNFKIADEGFQLGDVRIGVRGRLYGENTDMFSIGLYAGAILPTAYWVHDDELYSGSDRVRVNPMLLMEFRPLDRFFITLNAGSTISVANVGNSTKRNSSEKAAALDPSLIRQYDLFAPATLDTALGAGFELLDDHSLTIFGEANFSILSFSEHKKDKDKSDGSSEMVIFPPQGEAVRASVGAGVKYHTKIGLVAGAALHGGLASGVGVPLVRALFTLGWTTAGDPDSDGDGLRDSIDKCPNEPEDMDGFEDLDGCPEKDNDGDGVLDSSDKCPNEPEDMDGFEDQDGCPEKDNDGDGILDADDKCPNEAGIPERQGCAFHDKDGDGIEDEKDKCPDKPEDKDDFQDDDGCPDPDNDGDGILDVDDKKCPNVAGPQSNQGCPIEDKDKDGIPDSADKCPDKPETYNGIKDDDGCPDGKATVTVTATEVKITETIYFATGKSEIKKRSYKILDTVAAVLNKYDDITKLLVGGHTDDVGDDNSNLQLSSDRAKSVMEYLVNKGVDPKRLESEGYGETKPVCSDIPELTKTKRDSWRNRRKIKECRAANRRVEFRVIELNHRPVEASSNVTVVEKTETVEQ